MKEQVLELAKARGLDIAEEAVENLLLLGVDLVELLASTNPLAKGIVASLKPTVVEAIEKIDLDNDGE